MFSAAALYPGFSNVNLQQFQTFKSSLHLELTFGQDGREGSSFSFLHLDIPFFFKGTSVNNVLSPKAF